MVSSVHPAVRLGFVVANGRLAAQFVPLHITSHFSIPVGTPYLTVREKPCRLLRLTVAANPRFKYPLFVKRSDI